MIDVIIPTMVPNTHLRRLLEEIEETADYPYRIIFTGCNASAAANRNLGLSQVRGDMAIMVDDDIEFHVGCYGWLRVLAEALSRPDVVMVSAQLFTTHSTFAYMTGLNDCGHLPRWDSETVVSSRRLLTACCGFKHRGLTPSGEPYSLTFDEGYVGSGFEDIDFCNQLTQVRPDGVFLVCHDAWAVHRNEAKNQRGENWQHNEARYKRKWGTV